MSDSRFRKIYDMLIEELRAEQKFDEMCRVCEASYWLGDGVHPTAAGHELITRTLLETVKKDI